MHSDGDVGMDDLLVSLIIILLAVLVWWIFFSQTSVKERSESRPSGCNRVTEKTSMPQRTPQELAAERERRELEREKKRLEQIELRRLKLAERAAQDAEMRRKSLEEATRHTQEEDERRKRLAARNAADGTVGREFARFINQPVPPEVQKSMRAFLAGEFQGSDRSPLAYVGYRVGKTNGLPPWDRKRRMEVCFRIDIPKELRRDYSSWGGPASRERLNSMCAHIRMLAAMRHDRTGYEVAVAEWEGDAAWLQAEMAERADKFSRHGVTW